MRKRVYLSITVDVDIIPTDDGLIANAAIIPTDNSPMYLFPQTVACMCVCPLSFLNYPNMVELGVGSGGVD